MHVVIPPNTTAVVYIPSATKIAIAGMHDIQFENNYSIVNIGSGDYTFSTEVEQQ